MHSRFMFGSACKATVKAAVDAEYTRNRTRVIEIWNITQVVNTLRACAARARRAATSRHVAQSACLRCFAWAGGQQERARFRPLRRVGVERSWFKGGFGDGTRGGLVRFDD